MNSPTLDLDNDDSAIFSSSIIPKRKASANFSYRNCKQSKISTIQSLPKTKISSNNKTSEATTINLFLEASSNSLDGKEKNSNNLEKKPCDKLLNEMKEFNESYSSYFQSYKKSSNCCPFCLNSFEIDSDYITHMKQCAKKGKTTTQQLLDALEFQKNKIKDKKDFEFPSQAKKDTQKIVPKAKAVQKKLEIEYDLPLALTTSKSLEQTEKKSNNSTNFQQQILNHLCQSAATSMADSKRKRKKSLKNVVLKKRTKEDRQRIITEKAAVILLEDEGVKATNSNINQNSSIASDRLTYFQNGICHLWKLSENEENHGWYVEEIKSQIVLDTSQERKKPNEQKAEEIEDVEKEVSKLNLPKPSIIQDWRKMINNENFSDLFATSKDEETFYLHSLLLSVRCPVALEKDYKFIFKKFNLSVILVFLEYIYCGTLNDLKEAETENLLNLAIDFNYKELVEVLNCLKMNLKNLENFEKNKSPIVTSDCNHSPEITVAEPNAFEREDVTLELEDKDLFNDEMIDLTQSSPNASIDDDDDDPKNETNSQKSFYSFMQFVKKKEEEEEELRKDEEKESSIINLEMELIQKSIEEQNERMQKILTEFEEEELFISNTPEFEKVCDVQSQDSNDSIIKDMENEFLVRNKMNEDFIILSSDSDTRGSKRENEETPECEITQTRECRTIPTPECRATPIPECRRTRTPECRTTPTAECRTTPRSQCRITTETECSTTPKSWDCDVPYFDPYEDYNHFSVCNFSPIDIGNQSSERKVTEKLETNVSSLNETLRVDQEMNSRISSISLNIQADSSSKKSSIERRRKKRIDLSASRILRKSLGLTVKSPNLTTTRKMCVKNVKNRKRFSSKEEKDWLEKLTNSVVSEFSKSPIFKSSTPIKDREFVEMTPHGTRDIEIEESVTPYPNYSRMGEAVLKEHLAKYGIKKSLGKRKAEKILKHIYEELHPFLNLETGVLLRKVSTDDLKNKKNKKSKISEQEKGKKKKQTTKTKKSLEDKNCTNKNKSKESNSTLSGSDNSFNRSMVYHSNESDYEDSSDILTQCSPSNSNNVPSLMKEFFKIHPDFYEKILLYEPIWVKDLQKRLKETFKKSIKMTDLVNYLDQMCITFRSNSWQDNKKKKNAKTNKIPKM